MPLQLRRGTDSDRLAITPAVGEPIWTTDTNKLYIGDGSTVGGVEYIPNQLFDSASAISLIDSAYIVARTPPSLTVREVDSADNVNKTISSVSAINFDNWTGFQVTDLGNGEVKVALGSGFKYISVDGQDDIVAIGEDTLTVDAGTNVTLTTNAVTKALTINATFDSAEVAAIVDSSYIQARQTPQDFAYSSLTGAPTNVSSFTNDAGYITAPDALDSAEVFVLIDSAYVQSRQTPQDFAYSSLTGAPTNVSSFTNDAGYTTYDSANATGQITAAIDALINGAPGALDTLNELAAALGDDANFATTVTNAIAALPDSAEVQAIATTLVDSAYVQARQTPQDFAYSSLTGAPTNVSSFTNDANYLDSNTVTGVIDATYINSLVTATDSAAVINIVTDTVDSAYVTARIPEIPSVTVSGTAPASPTEGDLWYDNVTTGQLYTYVGTSWLSTAGLTTLQFSSIADLADVDSSAPTDGQYLTWNSATSQYVPTTLDAGTDSATVASIVTSTIDSSYTITGDVDNTNITTYFLNYKNTGYQIMADEGGWLYIKGTDTDKDIIVRTNASGSGENDFVFGKDASLTLPGSLVFQDATVQTTAYNTIAVTADINNVVDSAYVQSRQDFDYNSLINAPANVSDFSNDANYIATNDSAALASLTTTGNVVIGGNLQVNGTTVTVNSTDLNVTDNMIYMNAGESAGSPTASIDVGWAANVNDQGSYYHVGLFRDATDQTFKVYHQYTPEPDAAAQINTGDASFALAPFAASTLTGKYLGFDSDVTAAGLATQTYVTSTIDSAYIQARVDSAYVNGLVTIPSGVTVSGTAPASPTEGDLWYDNVTTGQLYTYVGTSWVSTAGLTTLQFSSIADLSDVDSSAPTEGQYLAWNSATSQYVPTTLAAGTDSGTVVGIVTSTVDSAYVQARQTAQDFAYSSLTGAPTNVSSFTNDAGYLTTAIDSTGVISLIDAAVAALVDTAPSTLDTLNELAAALGDDANFATTVTNAIATKLDSAQTIALIDSAYIAARTSAGTDSATVVSLITDTVDSAYVNNLVTIPSSSGVTVSGTAPTSPAEGDLWYDDTTTGELFVYENGSWTSTTIPPYTDSAAVTSIITSTVNSAYVQLRQTPQDFAYSSLTGAPTNVSSFTNDAGYLTTAIDSTGVTSLIDAAVAALVDTAPATLDTLNELAAALGDDANFATTVTAAIAAKLDSAQVLALIDSAYVNSLVTTGTDSATVVTLITSTVDSAYINARVDAVSGGGGADSATILSLINSVVDSDYLLSFAGASVSGVSTYEYTAAASQTTFSGTDDNGATLAYTAGNILVHRNGILIVSGVDYTATNGTSINLQAGADSGDTISIIAYQPTLVEMSEATISSDVQTATSGQTVFTVAHTQGQILVFLNGILLKDTDDYVSNGSTVVLTQAASEGDQITVHKFSKFVGGGGTLTKSSYEFLATANQTTFTGTADKGGTLAYNAGSIDVYRNGVLLVDSADYTGTSGNSIVLTFEADSGDVISVRTYEATFVNPSPRVPVKPWAAKTVGYVAVPGDKLIVDTTSNTVAISLPASPQLGDEVRIVDGGGNAETNNITISRNGNKIMGADSDFTIDVNWSAIELVYYNTTSGWLISGT